MYMCIQPKGKVLAIVVVATKSDLLAPLGVWCLMFDSRVMDHQGECDEI